MIIIDGIIIGIIGGIGIDDMIMGNTHTSARLTRANVGNLQGDRDGDFSGGLAAATEP